MTRPIAKRSIESFDPRMLQLLIRGARERIDIPFLGQGGKTKAHTFQREIHTLRSRMRHEHHPDVSIVARVRTRLLWGSKAVDEGLGEAHWREDHPGALGAYLIVEPISKQFDDIFKSIDLGALPLVEPTPLVEDEDSNTSGELDTWLDNLGKEPS